jgi:predicted nucleic-acid-binding Zn-ribbon protein
MKYSNTCPKCSNRRLAVALSFQQPDFNSSNLAVAVPAITVCVKGWPQDRESHGNLETWTCTRCGYTELYASGAVDFDDLAQRFPDQVRIIDATGR